MVTAEFGVVGLRVIYFVCALPFSTQIPITRQLLFANFPSLRSQDLNYGVHLEAARRPANPTYSVLFPGPQHQLARFGINWFYEYGVVRLMAPLSPLFSKRLRQKC